MSDEHQEKDFSFMLTQQFVGILIVKFIVLHSTDSLFLSLTLCVVWEQVECIIQPRAHTPEHIMPSVLLD